MGRVVRLADFRKPAAAPKQASPASGPVLAYYCTRCDADSFKLSPSGRVRCASCDVEIGNILVTQRASINPA